MPEDHEGQEPILIGIAWYRKDQWDLLRALSEDKANLEDTYEEWETWVVGKLKDLEQEGVQTERVDIDIRDLVAWCKRQRVPLDASARADYCAHRMRELDMGLEDRPSTGRRRPPKPR